MNTSEKYSSGRRKHRLKYPSLLPSWQAEVCPGVCFLRFIPDKRLAVYGKVLFYGEFEPFEADGFVPSVCYSQHCPEGHAMQTQTATMDRLLSQEQFDRARRLGWPSTDALLNVILNTPKN